MDILAGVLAYLAGIGAIFAGLVVSFSVFFSAPSQPLPPQAATAMIVKTAPPSKAAANTTKAKRTTARHEKRPDATSVAAAQEDHRKPVISASRLVRLVQEERARHWVYQQDANFQSRFVGYAD